MSGTYLNSTTAPTLQGSVGTLRTGLWLGVLGVFTATALAVFYELSSDQGIAIIIAGCAFFILMAAVLAVSTDVRTRGRNLVFALWFVLLGSEEVFSYVTEDAEKGQVSSGAYSEAMIWVFILFVFILYSWRHTGYWKMLFRGSYKWVSWFGVMCLLSCAYAEQPAFSLAWIIKLFLAILLLAACNYEMKGQEDLRLFFVVSQLGFAFLVLVPIVRLVGNPEAIATGRIFDVGTAPTMLSVDAGMLVLYSLGLMQAGKRSGVYVFSILGMLVMILAAGKTGIIGCVFGATVFFMLRGKFKAAVRFIVLLVVVGAIVNAVTPLGAYLMSYLKSDQASSFTGRTDVWAAGWELIKAKPILGRGFMSSRFLAYKISVAWQPGHLHNGFLEVLYNNGVIGLFVMAVMHFWIIRNLIVVMRSVRLTDALHPLAAGGFAIYLDILINGLMSRTFGSRPDATFMVLFSLVFFSDRLLHAIKATTAVREAPAWQGSALPAQA